MLTRHMLQKTLTTLLAAACLTGCLLGGSEDKSAGPALVDTAAVEAGEACAYGGVRIRSGNDANEDGKLAGDEIANISYACNARVDGFTTLVDTSVAQPSGACSTGGVKISSGKDLNENGALDADEIQDSELVCHGDRGAAGRDGTHGTDGSNGTDGEHGLNTLVEMTDIAPDPAGACYFGGTRIDTGLDTNRDGELAAAEIQHTSTVCAVQTNDRLTLVEHSLENPGANCEYGGLKVQVGFDDDGDKALAASEVDYSGYMCNEVVLISGKNSLIETTPATPAQCPVGGYMMRTGLDEDYDGALGASEVQSQALICSGQDGASALIETAPYSGASCGVDTLGHHVLAGRDTNRNGKLDASEVEYDEVICDGQDGILGGDGQDGADGADSLIRTSGDNGVCPYGGFKFEAGLDEDADGNLSSQEVSLTEYVCDGYDGLNSLVELLPHGGFCVYDGYRIDVGLDEDEDGVLSNQEVTNTAYVCDGLDGLESLVEITVDPADCPFTGIRFDTGLDTNANGFLEFAEIQNTTVICD